MKTAFVVTITFASGIMLWSMDVEPSDVTHHAQAQGSIAAPGQASHTHVAMSIADRSHG